MGLVETRLQNPDGLLAVPDSGKVGTGVLVLSGSSGRVEEQRVRLLAARGVTALSIRWWGDTGQPPGMCELPLETFTPALDRLAQTCERVVVTGTSYGAVASLLLGVHDRRVDAVIACAPSHVVWANVGPGHDGRLRPCRSMFTLEGVPLPFVPHDDRWEPDGDPPAYRGSYLQSLHTAADQVAAATIPVERIRGELLLVAGGDDQVWPSAEFARAIVTRREEHGLPASLVVGPHAGHRIVLPGEHAVQGGQSMLRGGTAEADSELGAQAWPAILQALRVS